MQVALVGEVARSFHAVDLADVDGRAAATKVSPVTDLELQVEMLRWIAPDPVVFELLDAAQRPSGSDPFDVGRQQGVDRCPVAGPGRSLERGSEVLGDLEVARAHRCLENGRMAWLRNSTSSSANSSPSGRWVINRTAASPAAAKTSRISAC